MKTTKEAKVWTPPRGIRYREKPDRPKPFILIWADPDTREEKSESFLTAGARELAAKALTEKRANHGSPVMKFDAARWARYLEFQRIVGPAVDPVIVAVEWIASKQGKGGGVAHTVKEAVTKYLALRSEEKSWGDSAARHAKTHLKRFAEQHGEARLNEVSADNVRDWLRVLKDGRGNPIGLHGVKDHRKNVSTFFQYALREKWGAIDNPCEWIKSPPIDDGDPTLISLREAFAFFKANRDERLIGRIALEAFGAVRYTTAGKIQIAGLNFDRRGIKMNANIHKTGLKDGRTRYRQGHPSNLWDWLKHAPAECWEMTLLQYREAKRNAGIRAGIRPLDTESDEDSAKVKGLRNVWRHSFISYHLARFKSIPLTQYLAQHAKSEETQGYEGTADDIDAARYFMITPETVLLSWDAFLALPVPATESLDSAALAQRLQVG